ncbi:MAG: cellulase family glycosylhydrolase [Chloroflexota bacterium]
MLIRYGARKVRALVLALFIILIAGTVLILVTQSTEDPFAADAIEDPPFTSLTYGVQIFAWWDTSITAGIHMDWTRLMGFTHVKQVFAWQDIQPLPDVWDFTIADRIVEMAEEKDLAIVARLGAAPDWAHPSLPPQESSIYHDAPPDDLADWGIFCSRIAQRYSGRIAAYQVWNEPNLTREWGDRPPHAQDYVALLAECSNAIRTADPNAIIISAGLSPTGTHNEMAHPDDVFLQAMYDANFEQYVDVVGVNAPGWGMPPSYGPDDAENDDRGRWATFRRVEDLRKIMIRNGDAGRQIAILEVGYTTDQQNPIYQWHAVDESLQREYLVEAYRYAAEHWRPWVGLMSAIYLANPAWTEDDEEFWWAFNDPQSGRMRPVFGGMAQMEKYCGDAFLPTRDEFESAYAPEYNPCN